MFLLGGFFILWTSDFWGLFGFRYICYCFLFSYFGPFAKMFSCYRVLIFARGWIVLFWKLEAARFAHLVILFFAVRHFRWSTTTIYFPITITFSVFAFFVAFLCSRVCVIKHSMCLNFSVFHRSVFALQIILRVVNGTIVTLIPLSFFLWVPRPVDAVDEGFAYVRCFCSSFSQIPPWFHLSMLSLTNEIINHFRVPKTLTFKTGLKCKTFLMKMSFKCLRTKNHWLCYLLVEVNFSWCFKNVACSNLDMKKYLLEWWTILGLAVPRKHISR